MNWNQGPKRPLTRDDVWELLKAGCNANEIAEAAGVSVPVAIGMINESIPRASVSLGQKLTLERAMPRAA